MKKQMQKFVREVSIIAFEDDEVKKDKNTLGNFVRERMDTMYGEMWNCVVSDAMMAGSVRYPAGQYIEYEINGKRFLLFKNNPGNV